MYFLWIDPGIRKLWYALIDKDLKIVDAWILLQQIAENDRIESFKRMLQIESFFVDLLSKYEIKNVWIEKLFFTKYNQANAEFVYAARGMLMWLFIKNECNIYEFTPIEMKKKITWNAKAEKILVQTFVMKLYWLKSLPEYEDAADALGLAYLVKNK